MKSLYFTLFFLLIIAGVGAYTPPPSTAFSPTGAPLQNPPITPVSTRGLSQTKTGSLSLTGTFQGRGNAQFMDQVRVKGVLYGGNETSTGTTSLSIGRSGVEQSAFVQKDVKATLTPEDDGTLQTRDASMLLGTGVPTVPVCSLPDGTVVLC